MNKMTRKRHGELENILKGAANHRRIQILELLERFPDLSGFDIGEKLGVEYASLKDHQFDESLASLLTEDYMRNHSVLPYSISYEKLELAMVNPSDKETIQQIEQMSGLVVAPRLVLENEFEEFLEKHHQGFV